MCESTRLGHSPAAVMRVPQPMQRSFAAPSLSRPARLGEDPSVGVMLALVWPALVKG